MNYFEQVPSSSKTISTAAGVLQNQILVGRTRDVEAYYATEWAFASVSVFHCTRCAAMGYRFILFDIYKTSVTHCNRKCVSGFVPAGGAFDLLSTRIYCPLHNKLNTQIFFRRSRDIFPAP